MTIDDDYPIFLIVPELLDFDKERNHEQSAAFLSQLFFKDREMDYATYLAFLEHFGRNEQTFQKILTKAHKNEIQILEKTPVSLLYGAYKKK